MSILPLKSQKNNDSPKDKKVTVRYLKYLLIKNSDDIGNHLKFCI